MKNRLYRSDDGVIGGVCSGLGDYFDVDPVLIRIGFCALACFGVGAGLLLYFVLWVAMPEE